MAYWGIDWTGPGRTWVKTKTGWRPQAEVSRSPTNTVRGSQTVAVSETAGTSGERCVTDQGISETSQLSKRWFYVSKRSTKESTQYLTIGQAIQQLDMCGVLQDSRRLQYICQILKRFFVSELNSLSGTAFNYILLVVQSIAEQACRTHMYGKVVQDILSTALSALENRQVSGKSLKFRDEIARLRCELDLARVSACDNETSSELSLQLLDMPDDCLLEIILKLDDPRDVVALSLSCRRLLRLAEIDKLWLKLAWLQFTKEQITTVWHGCDDICWKSVYSQLFGRFKVLKDISRVLVLCQDCHFVFWQADGHPCSSQEGETRGHQALTCDDFFRLFTE